MSVSPGSQGDGVRVGIFFEAAVCTFGNHLLKTDSCYNNIEFNINIMITMIKLVKASKTISISTNYDLN